MNEERDIINRMCAITISREYGSGGGEIASRLARRLGAKHPILASFGHEIISGQEPPTDWLQPHEYSCIAHGKRPGTLFHGGALGPMAAP